MNLVRSMWCLERQRYFRSLDKVNVCLAESNGKQLQKLDSTAVDKGEMPGPNELNIR